MGDVASLARARKTRNRAAKEAQAAANRAAFGRTGAQKQADLVAAERRERTLDGMRRDGGDE